MKKTLLLCFLLALFYNSYSQDTYPVNGSFDIRPGLIAFTNATLVINADQTISNGTLLVKTGTLLDPAAKVGLAEMTATVLRLPPEAFPN